MIIGYMTLLSIQFSLQYSLSILITCSSAFVNTSFVNFPKAAYVSSLTSFNRKVVLFLTTKPLTCAHINCIGLSSVSNRGSYYFISVYIFSKIQYFHITVSNLILGSKVKVTGEKFPCSVKSVKLMNIQAKYQ